MKDKLYQILDAFFTPGEEKLLSDLQGQLTELFEQELAAQKEANKKRTISMLQSVKIALLPSDFGFGYVTVNGKKRLMDTSDTHLLNELGRETNKRIDRKIKAIKEGHGS